MQATMELVNKGEYISWKLPKNTQIVLEKILSIINKNYIKDINF